jgi:hypothetical protein
MTAGKAERHRAPETGIKDRVSMATTRIDMVVRERGTFCCKLTEEALFFSFFWGIVSNIYTQWKVSI